MYCQQLDKLVEAIREKRRRLLSDQPSNIHFLQDNARPHTAHASVTKLASIGFTLLPHPPYSPDISPSDYYLFAPMKAALRGKTYSNANDLQRDLETWVESKSREFFATAFDKLPGRWRKCIEAGGDYFEHLSVNDEQ